MFWFFFPAIALALWPVKNSQGTTITLAQKVFGPIIPAGFVGSVLQGPPDPNLINASAMAKARAKITAFEGYRNTAYLDSVGVLTIGIGHKVVAGDKTSAGITIVLGTTISDAQVNSFFDKDVATAFAAALRQATDLKKYDADFIAALTSVNFQLGTGWTSTFANTYNDLRNGNVQSAIARLDASAWKKQTPQRVAEFQSAILNAFA